MIKLIEVLPNEYQRIAYIESDGSQYIDTGFVPNQDTRIICEVARFTCSVNDEKYMYGSRSNNSNDQFSLSIKNESRTTEICITMGSSTISRNILSNISGHEVFEIDKNGAYNQAVSSFSGIYPIYLFAMNDANVISGIANNGSRIYSFQIFDNGTLVRDFIPSLRKSDSVVGLYDVVNGVFYTNSGTGKFLAGRNLNFLYVTQGGHISKKHALRRMRLIQKKREIWYLGDAALDSANRPSDGNTSFIVGFESNGARYERIDVSFYQHPRYPDRYMLEGIIYFVDATDFTAGSADVASVYGWGDNENHRTIVLDEPATGGLLEWLSKVATKLN